MKKITHQTYVRRFWAAVTITDIIPEGFTTPHWFFDEKYLRDDGYGQISGYRGPLAHRFSWELHKGKIPKGLQIDHLCRVRRCCNPEHLEPVSRRINILRGESFSGINSRKNKCPKGHSYDEDNTYVTPKGGRQCRICMGRIVRKDRLKSKIKTRKIKIVNV